MFRKFTFFSLRDALEQRISQQLIVAILTGSSVMGSIPLVTGNDEPLLTSQLQLCLVLSSLCSWRLRAGLCATMLVFKRDFDG
ncbi:hypothetical protein NHF46_01160 [Arthrobacter alpinus]|nr:hypothetical protein [Arthrobacter alpinus]